MSSIVLSCVTCKEKFATRELMKDHFGSQLHTYNVDRKIKGLPPVSKKEFDQIEQSDDEEGEDSSNVKYFCKICKKSFGSPQTLSSHLRSQKHQLAKKKYIETHGETAPAIGDTVSNCAVTYKPSKNIKTPNNNEAINNNGNLNEQNLKKLSTPDNNDTNSNTPKETTNTNDTNGGDHPAGNKRNDDPFEVPVYTDADLARKCLFCNKTLMDSKENYQHLKEVHAFRLPWEDLLRDLEGILAYLQRKIQAGLCLWCNEKSRSFVDINALRLHMYRMGHDQINFTDYMFEYVDYYNMPDSSRIDPEEAEFNGKMYLPNGKVIGGRSTLPEHSKSMFSVPEIAKRNALLGYSSLNTRGGTGGVLSIGGQTYTYMKKDAMERISRQERHDFDKKSKLIMQMEVNTNRGQFRGHMV